MADRELTDKQKALVAALFECGGDRRAAATAAGYSKETTLFQIYGSKHLREAIVEATADYIKDHGPKAASGIVAVINNPTEPGNKEKLMAAKELLDRGGVVKAEKQIVESDGPQVVFVLPEKKYEEEEE